MLKVEYRDEGWMPDRDAYFWGVRFARDGKYLGVAIGMIDGLNFRRAPAAEPERSVWFNAGPRAIVNRLVSAAREGTLREEWNIDAEMFMLTTEELLGQATDGGRDDAYQHGELLAEVEV